MCLAHPPTRPTPNISNSVESLFILLPNSKTARCLKNDLMHSSRNICKYYYLKLAFST